MPRHVRQQLAGWGNWPREEVCAFRPESPSEIPGILESRSVPSFIGRGLGRSYGDASLNRLGGVIRCERLDRFLSWDAENHILECESGVSIDELLHFFLPRGFFPPVTPGTRFVTVGGAIAADVHGKNHHRDGSFAGFLEDFRLLTGAGELLTCSRTANEDLFWATLGGMGLTGIVLSARIRLRPVETGYIWAEYAKAPDLDRVLELLTGDAHHRYSVAWIDCLASGPSLGRSVVIRGDHAAPDELPPDFRAAPLAVAPRQPARVPFNMPGWLLNPLTVGAFNGLYYRRHRQGREVVGYESFFYPLDSILNWNRIYGGRGFLQYQFVLPPAASRQGLVEILTRLSAARCSSFLAVLKMFGEGNPGPLSFPMPGATLALDLPNTGGALLSLLEELDRIVVRYGGRVYLAKDARLSAESFEAMYPRAEEFRRLKALHDPENVFNSSLARRLGLDSECGVPSTEQAGRSVEAAFALAR